MRPGQDSPNRPRLALAATLSVQSVATLALTAPTVMAPAVAPLLDVPAHHIGWYVGIAYGTAMASGLLAGTLAARIGAIRLSRIALLCCAAGLGLAAAAAAPGAVVLVLLAGLVIGVGYGLPNPTASLVLARHTPPDRRGLYFSIKQTGVPIGVGLSGLLVPPLIATMPWPAAVLTIAAACVLLAVLLRRAASLDALPRGTTAAAADTAPAGGAARLLVRPLVHVWQTPALRRLGVSSLLYSMTQVSFITFVVPFLALEHGYALVAAAAVLSLSQVVAVACRVMWGAVSDRWIAPSRLLGALGLAMGAAVAAFGTVPALGLPAVTLAIAIACAATAVAWNGVFYAELAVRVRADEMASASGGVQVLTFCGAMTGPIVFSFAVGAFGEHGRAFLAIAPLPVAAGLWLLAHDPPAPARRA